MQLEAVGMGLPEPFHRSRGGVSPMPFGNGLGTRRHPARNLLVLSEPVEVHGFGLSVSGLSPDGTGGTPDEYLEEIASQATAIPRMVVLRDSAPAGPRCGDAPPFRRNGHARNPGTREAAAFPSERACGPYARRPWHRYLRKATRQSFLGACSAAAGDATELDK